MKRGDRVALTDSLFGGVTIYGWLWGTSVDEDHEQEPGCLIFTVLPFHEEGTANVWEGRHCVAIGGREAPAWVFAALEEEERAVARAAEVLAVGPRPVPAWPRRVGPRGAVGVDSPAW